MIATSLWQQIKNIVECDKKIVIIYNNIQAIHDGISSDSQKIVAHSKKIHDIQNTLFTLQKDVKLKELDAQQLKETEDAKRSKLDSIKDQREYMALEREISMLSQKRFVLEDIIVKDWFQVERIQEDLNLITSTLSEQEAIAQHSLAIKQENLKQLEADLEKIILEREKAHQILPTEWQRQYDRMRNSVEDPIVNVTNKCCSSCFYSLSHHDFSSLKKGNIVVCKSCYRFLYDDDAEQHSATY